MKKLSYINVSILFLLCILLTSFKTKTIKTVDTIISIQSTNLRFAGKNFDNKYPPPVLVNPVHIVLAHGANGEDIYPLADGKKGNADRGVSTWIANTTSTTNGNGKYYTIKIPEDVDALITTEGTTRLPYPISIEGGRNVIIKGLEIELITQPGNEKGTRVLHDQTFTSHNPHPVVPTGHAIGLRPYTQSVYYLEGLFVDTKGHDADGIVVSISSKSINLGSVYIVNSIIQGIESSEDIHGDIFQSQSGYLKKLIVENVTAKTAHHGFTFSAPIETVHMRNVHFDRDLRYDADFTSEFTSTDAAGFLADHVTTPYGTPGFNVKIFSFENIYVNRKHNNVNLVAYIAGKSFGKQPRNHGMLTSTKTEVHPEIHADFSPPNGDFVLASQVGFNYQSELNSPTIYYVAPSGNNGDGTSKTTPWSGINNIEWNKINAGDTVIFMDGVYSSKSNVSGSDATLMIKDISGEENKEIVFKAEHQGKAILDGDYKREFSIFLYKSKYIIIEGFEIRNYWSGGVIVYAPNITIKRNNIHHVGNLEEAINDDGTPATDKINFHQQKRWGCEGIYSDEDTADGLIVDGNIIAHTGRHGVLSDELPRLDHGMYIVSKATIINNLIIDAQGSGIQLTGHHKTNEGSIISNNTILDTRNGQGIYIWDKISHTLIQNNIIVNPKMYGIFFVDNPTQNHIVRNNIFYQIGLETFLFTYPNKNYVQFSNNLLDTDPLLDSEYKPKNSSPVIGTGIKDKAPDYDLIGNPRGTAIDIGAYQYVKSIVNNDDDGDGVLNDQEQADGTAIDDACSYNPSSQDVTIVSQTWKTLDCDGDGVDNGTEIIDGTNPKEICSFVVASQTGTKSQAWQDADCDKDGNPNGTDPNPLVPTAADDTFEAILGEETVYNILENDDFLPSSEISITKFGGTAGGDVQFEAATGEIKYTPLAIEKEQAVTVAYKVCKASICTTATVIINVKQERATDDEFDKITIYPIPTKKYIHIDNITDEGMQAIFYDSTGKLLMIKPLLKLKNKIDLGYLQKAYYFLKIVDKTHTKIKTVKLIIR